VLLRLPWLNSRKRLLTAVAIETLLFGVLYSFWFKFLFGSWPEFSLPLSILLFCWLVCSYVLGRYYDFEDPRTDAAIKQLTRTLLTLLLTTGIYLTYNWITANTLGVEDARSLLIPFLLALGFCSGLVQFCYNRFLQVRLKPSTLWQLVGTSEQFEKLLSEVAWGRLNVRLVFNDSEESLSVHPSFNHLERNKRDQNLAGIVVSDFNRLQSDQLNTLLDWQAKGIAVYSQMRWCENVLQRYPPVCLSSVDLLRGEFAKPQGSFQLRLKRVGDVAVSASLLLLCLPLLLLFGLLIWLQDQGPVFYSQLRNGLAGEPFKVWKLRSMRVDAEVHGAQWSSRDDSRITPIGRLLRLTRLDELPQLCAVLQGKMSLIGPRPERPEIEQKLERVIPYYRLRHLMRPGLSGWAQVNYPYGASEDDSEKKLSYDLYYLRNFTFWLDLLIFIKTIRLVFNMRGAMAQEPRNPTDSPDGT